VEVLMAPLDGGVVGEASAIGLDIAKQAFQAHGADVSGNVGVLEEERRDAANVGLIDVSPSRVS
jgi:hypothetical protein